MSSHLTEPAFSGSGDTDTARWGGRIARARELAAQCPSAIEILTFYAGLAEYLRSLCPRAIPVRPATTDFIDSVDLDAASAAVPDFLVWLQRNAPARLASVATRSRDLTRADWRELMRQSLMQHDDDIADRDQATAFVLEALLQPFAEAEAICRSAGDHPDRLSPPLHSSRCPVCGRRPAFGVLREAGHGAKRMLGCALCLSEWDFLRVQCPACDEQRFDALPVYTSETFPHVRIEACDTCRRYLKTIDLTKNGLAVPLVDDLASVPLDLWARDQGYRRIRENLLRT